MQHTGDIVCDAIQKYASHPFHTNSISFRGGIFWNSTTDVIRSSNTVFTLSKTLKTGLVKFVFVIFVYNSVKFCSFNIFSVSWYLLVLLISTNYFSIQL